MPRKTNRPRDLYDNLRMQDRLFGAVALNNAGKLVIDPREDDIWQDIDADETRRQKTIRKSRLVQKKDRSPSRQAASRMPSPPIRPVQTFSMHQSKQRFMSLSRYTPRRVATPQDIDLIAATLQGLEMRLEAIDRELRQLKLRSQATQPQPSLIRSVTQSIQQVLKPALRMIAKGYRHICKARDMPVQQPRPTKKHLYTAAVAASCYFGFFHYLLPVLRSLDHIPWELIPGFREAFLLYPNLSSFLGLVVHTSSLPLLIAVNPRTKKAFSHFKDIILGRRFFSNQQRRSLGSSSSARGPRKETAFRDLISNHPDLLDRPFPMAAVLNDLRNLQALRGPASSREYKVAERRLFRVQHESEVDENGPLTVRQVTELLQPDDSVGWTTIKQRLLQNRVDAIDSLSKEDRARVMFQRIYGIGATKAERFVQAGFLTLEQLREATLERAQRIGLDHMDDIECLIPRSESEQWREILLDIFRTVDPRLGSELLGSFRRGDHYSSDLDFVVFHPEVVNMRVPRASNPLRQDPNPRAAELFTSIVDKLALRNLLADELLAHGPLSIKGLVRLSQANAKARRIDLNFAPFDRRAFYTLAKTGDSDLMVHLRGKAKAKGWALNEYGIGPANQNGSAWTENLLEATDEKQIFDFLGVPYLEPEERSFSVYAKKLRITRP